MCASGGGAEGTCRRRRVATRLLKGWILSLGRERGEREVRREGGSWVFEGLVGGLAG